MNTVAATAICPGGTCENSPVFQHWVSGFGASSPGVVLCLVKIFFIKVMTGLDRGFLEERWHPRTVLLLIAGVQVGVIGLLVADHAEDNFEQPLAQTS